MHNNKHNDVRSLNTTNKQNENFLLNYTVAVLEIRLRCFTITAINFIVELTQTTHSAEVAFVLQK